MSLLDEPAARCGVCGWALGDCACGTLDVEPHDEPQPPSNDGDDLTAYYELHGSCPPE